MLNYLVVVVGVETWVWTWKHMYPQDRSEAKSQRNTPHPSSWRKDANLPCLSTQNEVSLGGVSFFSIYSHKHLQLICNVGLKTPRTLSSSAYVSLYAWWLPMGAQQQKQCNYWVKMLVGCPSLGVLFYLLYLIINYQTPEYLPSMKLSFHVCTGLTLQKNKQQRTKWLPLKYGMEWWNGMMEWNDAGVTMEY